MVVEGALSKKLAAKLQQLWKAAADGEGSGRLAAGNQSDGALKERT